MHSVFRLRRSLTLGRRIHYRSVGLSHVYISPWIACFRQVRAIGAEMAECDRAKPCPPLNHAGWLDRDDGSAEFPPALKKRRFDKDC
ncbi:hypothetical protein MCOR27_007021 [Pyricularia oryzae]|uniref:Uncharacterized protein n=2 Tax=Pyricularia TaxID=48558 RepID=A0ABQ8NGB1_PYRGI|nr:hypothetical protein MCOR27_007021 [Pyricularia oryzae]KAI6296071.1 hypothetical protein MCOR33_007193 [Pyricularia grisea]KAI6286383.1 hypothetical protein MCOR26_001084 [Pyricularia oryzae]KAI6314126.1 hypothetical protein MCOR29_007465 [Pyricularia oryzae]KAI6336896.1 hypothetical protein MCOR28_008923 [Pyricularia oryzae]